MVEELRHWQRKVLFTIEMLRWGGRENHSYVCGVYDDEFIALKEAWQHMNFRANKYDAVVIGWELNGGREVYRRELKADSWNVFAESCKDMAEKLKPFLDEDEEAPQTDVSVAENLTDCCTKKE